MLLVDFFFFVLYVLGFTGVFLNKIFEGILQNIIMEGFPAVRVVRQINLIRCVSNFPYYFLNINIVFNNIYNKNNVKNGCRKITTAESPSKVS